MFTLACVSVLPCWKWLVPTWVCNVRILALVKGNQAPPVGPVGGVG